MHPFVWGVVFILIHPLLPVHQLQELLIVHLFVRDILSFTEQSSGVVRICLLLCYYLLYMTEECIHLVDGENAAVTAIVNGSLDPVLRFFPFLTIG